MALDYVIWGCGFAVEAILVALLARNRVFQAFPAFFFFVCWSLISDVVFFALQFIATPMYFRLYEVQMVVDSAMIFAVLVELAWSVLRPIRSSLPKGSWIGIVVLIGLAGLLLWPLAGFAVPGYLTPEGRDFFHLQQTFAILRVVVFLGMTGFSQLLAIGWRNRELQVATGMGFYSIVSLSVTILHTHQVTSPQYHWMDRLVAASYLGALAYWVLAFATKEAKRRNFSPQMQNFLVIVGSTAKTSRVALTDMLVTKSRRKDH